MSESYEIEPWMPAISPGAPVPAPKYVPFDYSKMTPGNYFSHTLGWGGHSKPNIDDVYRKGVRVTELPQELRKVKMRGAGLEVFKPTAWNQSVVPEDLGSLDQNKYTAQRLGRMERPFGRGNIPRRAHAETELLYTPRRTPKADKPTVILKGDREMFFKPGPDYKPAKGVAELPPNRPYSGHINPKRMVGHFPAGSNEMVTKPGMVTGRMPMVRGIGGGLIDMFMEGPEMQKAKSDPYYGMGKEERRNLEHAYQYGL
jgi:hypothetical protein